MQWYFQWYWCCFLTHHQLGTCRASLVSPEQSVLSIPMHSNIKSNEHCNNKFTCHMHQWVKQTQQDTQQSLLLHAAMFCILQDGNSHRPVWSCAAPCFKAFLAWRSCTRNASVQDLATARSGPITLILHNMIFNRAYFSTGWHPVDACNQLSHAVNGYA